MVVRSIEIQKERREPEVRETELELKMHAERKATKHCSPKGPCTQIVSTLALRYLYRDYIKAKVYAIWVHGILGQ